MALKNPRYEQVAQLFACGEGPDAIAECLGYRNRNQIFLIVRKPEVQARIAKLFDEHRTRNGITVDTLLSELDDAFRTAKRGGQPNAMVQATLGKARLLGMLTERFQIAADVQVKHVPDLSNLTSDELRMLAALGERLGSPASTAGQPHRN